MLLKIAWRNIWRSKTRSFVVILSIAIGVWALSFILSFTLGMTYSYIEKAIRYQWSHLQIHHPQFSEDKLAKYYIGTAANILDTLTLMPEVQAVAPRTIISGMVSSSRGASGVEVVGVVPELETAVTHLESEIVEGEYFSQNRSAEILLSKRTAERLKVNLRNRVVLTFQNLDGTITSAAFRVVGLFSTGNMIFDERRVFVKKSALQQHLMGLDHPSDNSQELIHEIAVFLSNTNDLLPVKKRLQDRFKSVQVQDYRELSPDIELYESQIQLSNTIMITIFMLALIFGIVNTMLMAVLERYRELGMLMAIGMNKPRVFGMVVLETLFLGLVAAPIGLGLGWLTVYLLKDKGIDLSAFSRGMERFGLDTVVFPVLSSGLYVQIAVAVFITALLASLYPASKAIGLRPVEALQKI